MAVRHGFEPCDWGFASLHIIASLCSISLVLIHSITRICKVFVAFSGTQGQENLCAVVRAWGRCVELCGTQNEGQNLCEIVR